MICYLSYDGLTDPLGQSQILPYILGLAKKNYKIYIFSFEKKGKYISSGKEINNVCEANGISWIPLSYTKSPPILSTIYDLLILQRAIKKCFKSNNIQIVHCRSYLTSLVGLWAKRKYKTKFIFDMRGFWADERVEGGLWNLKNPMYRMVYNYFKKKEIEFIRQSDHIITLTHAAKKEILQWEDCKSFSKKISVIPTCVDFDLFDPEKVKETDKLRSELGLNKDEFLLLYLGSLGTWYMLDEMLLFFKELKKEKKIARFLFVTPDIQLLQDRIETLKLRNDDFIIKSVFREQVPSYILLADCSVVFIKPVYSKIASSATKIPEIMAMGVPLVTNKGWGDIDMISQKATNLIHLVDRPTIENFGEVVRNLEKNKYKEQKHAKEIMKDFSLENGISAFQQVYFKL